jgi:hypothetical protein
MQILITSTTTAPILPDYAPVPTTALSPALNDQGYYVGRVERNLSGSPMVSTCPHS